MDLYLSGNRRSCSDIHMPPFLAVHLHKTKCICQLRPHYSSKEQMMAMILELRRYTYQVDRNSQFVVLFPPTSIHSAVLTPTLSSQVKGTKVRVTPSARRLYWTWTILLQEMAIHCHGSHSNSGFNTWVCRESTIRIVPLRKGLNCCCFRVTWHAWILYFFRGPLRSLSPIRRFFYL